MKDSFNLMCAYNPTKKFYCQQKAMEWEKKGAFKDDPDVIFPNPCDVDCNKPTGKAIADMGCCLGSLVFVMEKTKQMSAKEIRAVKAATYKCGGMKALQVCNGKDSGIMLPTKVMPGKSRVDKCPATSAEEKTFKTVLAKALKVKPVELSLVACVPAGSSCEGGSRRMGGTHDDAHDSTPSASGNTMNYKVTVSGSEATVAAKEKAVQANIATNEANAGGKSAPAKSTSAAATVLPANSVSMASRDSLSLSLGIFGASLLLTHAM